MGPLGEKRTATHEITDFGCFLPDLTGFTSIPLRRVQRLRTPNPQGYRIMGVKSKKLVFDELP